MLVGLDRGLGAWIVTVPEPTPRNGEIWLRWRTKQCMLVALDRGLGAWAVTVPEPTLCILLSVHRLSTIYLVAVRKASRRGANCGAILLCAGDTQKVPVA